MPRDAGGSGLAGLSLEQLIARYPDAWAMMGPALVAAVESGRAEALAELVHRARMASRPWKARLDASGGNAKVLDTARPYLAAERMAILAVERTSFAASVGRTEGTVRLSLWSGLLVQRLLFARGLERKPVSMRAFRLVWPLVGQRRLVMPLVQQRGIYCFYSLELVQRLAHLLGHGSLVEIAAGDGTLSRFLRGAGSEIRATDDQSWDRRITYPPDVERLDARAALDRHRPRAVICSWPPPGNTFERHVFATPSVEVYVVVASRHRFATGAWKAYQAQEEFTLDVDDSLSRLVLPPDIDPTVLVFRRRSAAPRPT